MAKKRELVAVNEQGRRIGESHPRARLTDHEIDLVRELVESLIRDGKKPMEAYEIAAEKFETKTRYVGKIVRCERRAETVAGYRRLRVPA